VWAFCITIYADYALELKQLKSAVNRAGIEVKFASGADFAYIGTVRFYVSQYFVGGFSSWRH